jgi:hypothetical protein
LMIQGRQKVPCNRMSPPPRANIPKMSAYGYQITKKL